MPRKSSTSRRWPVVVKVGSAEAKIYRHEKKGGEYFILTHYEGGTRKQRWFADYEAARTEADIVVAKISRGQVAALELTGADRDSYVHAQLLLKPMGIPLHAAIEEFLAAKKVLGPLPLLHAAEEYVRRHKEKLPEILVPDLVVQGLEAKRKDGMSERYLVQLKSDWKRFATGFNRPIHTITSAEMDDWLRDQDLAKRTRNNLRTAIITLFSYAKQRGFLPKHLPTEAEGLSKAKVVDNDIAIFTPEQITRLLKAAPPELIPFITLGAFAGLRSAEIHRLAWEAVRIDDGFIELKAKQAKTASRRLVPLEPNLRDWLLPHVGKGPIIHDKEQWKDVTALGKKLELGWPQNVLRHSYITYRVARDKDVNKVALDSGNSPNIIFKHYRELAPESQGQKWFAVTPETVAAFKHEKAPGIAHSENALV
jgi:Site-specific recombinase XerD